jgi:hypothetical protein
VSVYIKKTQPKQYKPPSSTHVKCTKKNCHACAALEQATLERLPLVHRFVWEGNEAALAEQCGQNDETKRGDVKVQQFKETQ